MSGELATDETKTYPVSVRLSEEAKAELDNAAWIEDIPATDIIKEGIDHILGKIRAKHGGKIPERPRRQSTPKKGKRK